MLLSKPCPSCNHDHGFSSWKVANSSVAKPLRCKHCHQNFHQTGLGVLLAATVFAPVTVLSVILIAFLLWLVPAAPLWLTVFASSVFAIAIALAVPLLYVNRKLPLARGPRYG